MDGSAPHKGPYLSINAHARKHFHLPRERKCTIGLILQHIAILQTAADHGFEPPVAGVTDVKDFFMAALCQHTVTLPRTMSAWMEQDGHGLAFTSERHLSFGMSVSSNYGQRWADATRCAPMRAARRRDGRCAECVSNAAVSKHVGGRVEGRAAASLPRP